MHAEAWDHFAPLDAGCIFNPQSEALDPRAAAQAMQDEIVRLFAAQPASNA